MINISRGLLSVVALSCGVWAAAPAHPVSPEAKAQARQEFGTGLALVQQGRIDEAITHTTKAASLDPQFGEAEYNLGVLYSQKNNLTAAIRHMKRAVALQPGNPSTHYNLGYFYQVTGKFEEAEKQYRKAIGLDPKAANAQLNLGILLSRRGAPDAAEHCRKAFELNPSNNTPACPR